MWAVLLAFTVGCSDSSAPDDVSVSGSWTANWTNMSGGGITCQGRASLQLSQSGDTFTGTYSNLRLLCGGPESPPFSGSVVNGTVNGSSVAFDLDTRDSHQSGTISGNSMSGSATWIIEDGPNTYTLQGSWAASR